MAASPANADGMACTAKTGAAKILKSPKQADAHPLWPTAAHGGSSLTIVDGEEAKGDGAVPYISGSLVSPRDGAIPGKVFIIASEWECY